VAIGCSYFGSRILRHVAADMDDLASRGFTGVLHTFSENDFNWYREQMDRIIAVSHAAGLEVQVGPWGLGHVFGGEAESLFAAQRPDLGQVFSDGTRVGAGCPSQPEFRAFVRSWADIAVASGADRVFWDEPHWAHPVRFARTEGAWTCVCEACDAGFHERFGEPMPRELTREVAAFREAVLTDFLTELVDHVASIGGRSTICLLPEVDGLHAVSAWEPIAAIPRLDTLATDPYWSFFAQDADDYVGGQSRRVAELAAANGVTPQIWIQGFKLGPEQAGEIHAAVAAARAAGVTDLWTWGYEACGHMSHLHTREPEIVWETLTDALTGRDGG
jgi:hypothetical protein